MIVSQATRKANERERPEAPGLSRKKILTYRKDPATGWSFDRPMYLIMNIACGGPDEPAPADSELPQFMTVDYVRVYQQIHRLQPQ
jgi:hypothetical protein